jgi:hypothetical protein
MNRSVLARVLTVALMAGMLWTFGRKQRAFSPQAQPSDKSGASATGPDDAGGGPESVVWRMVDATRAGDPAGYLECYAGEMEPRLRRDFQEMGSVRSRDYLLEAHRQLKGVAVQSPRMSSPSEAQIPVEYVYEDRNEVQQVYVKRIGGLWKIDRVEGAEQIKTLVPYGTPARN